MEVLAQVQALLVEHAVMVGLGLLVAVFLAGALWYWMSRKSSDVLVNKARVNEVSTGPTQEQMEQAHLQQQAQLAEHNQHAQVAQQDAQEVQPSE